MRENPPPTTVVFAGCALAAAFVIGILEPDLWLICLPIGVFAAGCLYVEYRSSNLVAHGGDIDYSSKLQDARPIGSEDSEFSAKAGVD